ncbi:MAG: efflux RND transporter periplasmic adaptor subunit [Mesorhizobium sp.]
MIRVILTLGALALASQAALAEATVKLEPTTLTEWKAVYAQVESRTTVPARARIGGTVIELDVTEGDTVKSGQVIALVHDEKLDFQIQAVDAQLKAMHSQLQNAQTNLGRAEQLIARGVTTSQQLDQMRTQVAVFQNQIAATEAQRSVIEQQQKEGKVLAPISGLVLTVPVTRDAVIMAGEPLATIGGGGFFLRLAMPERHAAALEEGAKLEIITEKGSVLGTLAKIYPLIENGRVSADVEVPDLQTRYVDRRVLVHIPVGERSALIVPEAAVAHRSGLDFVLVAAGGQKISRVVVPGEHVTIDGVPSVEILTGLVAGESVIVP